MTCNATNHHKIELKQFNMPLKFCDLRTTFENILMRRKFWLIALLCVVSEKHWFVASCLRHVKIFSAMFQSYHKTNLPRRAVNWNLTFLLSSVTFNIRTRPSSSNVKWELKLIHISVSSRSTTVLKIWPFSILILEIRTEGWAPE